MNRKFIFIVLVAFLPLSAFVLNADEPPHQQEIPLHQIHNGNKDYDSRNLIHLPVECHYFDMMNAVVTTIWSDIGDVILTVTNCSTGNVWYDTFDSAQEPQTVLSLSGEPGVYEIVYITESGGVYEGTLVLN